MKFNISETIDATDTQRVLRVLETCLREVSTDATASDREIVLRGLGPSPVSINPRDVAVFRLRPEGGKTVIDGDITFIASALLQNSSQEDIVRSKLDRIFDRVKMELDTQPIEPAATDEQQPVVASAVTERAAESVPQPAVAIEEPPPATRLVDAVKSIDPPRAAAPLFSAYHRQTEPEDFSAGNGRRIAAWMAAIVVFLLVGASLVYYRTRVHDLLLVLRSKAAYIAQSAAATGPETSSVAPATTEDQHSQIPKDQPPQTPNEEQPTPSVVGTADIRTWLENWAAAMRSRDAVAQSAFYAGTLDRYMDRHNVSRDAVAKDREATMRMRKGLWTMRIEDIVIERQTNSEAKVHLVKHFIDKPADSETLESSVPTQIVLKRIDGRWKITSEFDLPPSQPAINTAR